MVRGIAAVARRKPGRSGTLGLLAGPISYIAVIATWAALLTVGWALVFLPQLPQGFHFDSRLDPAKHSEADPELLETLRLAIADFAETLRRRLRMAGDNTDETLRHDQSDHGPLEP